jgi:hypothetical protein
LSESCFAGTHFSSQNDDVTRTTQLGNGRSDTMGVSNRLNQERNHPESLTVVTRETVREATDDFVANRP